MNRNGIDKEAFEIGSLTDPHNRPHTGGEHMLVRYALLTALVAAALVTDIRTNRIPNALTVPAMGAGLMLNVFTAGTSGLRDSLLGWAVPMGLLFFFYATKMLGAGDIKLFSAVGALMGLSFSLWTMAFSFLAGGLMSLVLILARRNARARITHFCQYLKTCAIQLTLVPYRQPGHLQKDALFPFAWAVAAGVAAAVLQRTSVI